MNRTNNCGELSKANLNEDVRLSGWVNKIREKGFIIWIDLRDRYGITQLVFDKDRSSEEVFSAAKSLGREFVIEIEGEVIEKGGVAFSNVIGKFPKEFAKKIPGTKNNPNF